MITRVTQVELQSGNDIQVYWLEHNPYEQPLKVGSQVSLLEETDKFWIVRTVCITIPTNTPLPPHARVGTIGYLYNSEK